MSSPVVTRRDFTRLAILGSGAAMLGCSKGILAPEPELVVKLSGMGRLYDDVGRVIGTQELAPGIASGVTRGSLVRATEVENGVGRLQVPAPSPLAFATTKLEPQVLRRSDRAGDGTLIETVSELLGPGIPHRRTVRIPEHGVVLTDSIGFGRQGGLSVFERRTIQIHQRNRLMAELVILGDGEIRLSTTGRFRSLLAGSPLFPEALAAQNCGSGLALEFASATLAVLAALAPCAEVGPLCLFGLIGALIRWARVIGEMERCRK